MSSTVLSLTRYSHSNPKYLVVKAAQLSNPFFLTPRVMRWKDDTWIFDLSPCQSYWQYQAQRVQVHYLRLLQDIVEQQEDCITAAVCCAHPWQGLLLVEKSKQHFLVCPGPFANRLLQEVTWQEWLAPFATLPNHIASLPNLKNNCKHICETMRRLNITNPLQVKNLQRQSIQRRFGRWLGCAWDWLQPKAIQQYDLFHSELTDFPWQSWHPPMVPHVHRSLDYAVFEWQQVEPLLQEDLNKLCSLDSWNSSEHVLRIEWQITLDNLDILTIPIAFRHPHSLHLAMPEQSIALLQAYYAFMAEQEQMQNRDTDLEYAGAIPLIAWRLIVPERIQLTTTTINLFAEGQEAKSQNSAIYHDIIELENKLPLALESYQLKHSFHPFDAYQHSSDSSASTNRDDFAWEQAATKRPLFLHRQKKAWDTLPKRRTFLERVSGQWWNKEPSMDFYRCWYRGRCYWISRNRQGETVEHAYFD